MQKKTLVAALVAGLGLVGAVALALGAARNDRADCPGRIVCPLTGETVCRAQCPLAATGGSAVPRESCCPAEVPVKEAAR